MKRLLSLCAAALLVALLPSPVAAGPIDLKDPIIGVRGGDFGSADITTTTPLLFNSGCPLDLSQDGFACLAYKITPEYDTSGIFSIVLHIENTIGGGGLVFSPADTSDSFFLTPLGDNRIQISATAPITIAEFANTFRCPNTGPSAEGSHQCGAGEDLLIYIKPTPDVDPSTAIFSSSVEQINGQPVPEPATLLLLGTGMATIAGKRLRRKTTN